MLTIRALIEILRFSFLEMTRKGLRRRIIRITLKKLKSTSKGQRETMLIMTIIKSTYCHESSKYDFGPLKSKPKVITLTITSNMNMEVIIMSI